MRPSLNSLQTFATVAAIGSFTQAAKLLNVTQGAVSQQIAKLERELGIKLFHRQARQLTLTSQGRRLYLGISPALSRIDAQLDAVLAHRSEEVLTISTFGSIAAQWLMPRIGVFEAAHPNVRIHIDTTLRLVNFIEEGIELGIRFGTGEWTGVRAEPMFRHRFFPLAGADYAKKLKLKGSLNKRISVIKNLPLYYDLEAPSEWSQWFAEAGSPIEEVKLARGFSDTLVMMSALRNGLEGVALIGDHLSERDVKEGTLVRLADHYIEPQGAFYLVYPYQIPLSPGASAFREWLLNDLSQTTPSNLIQA